MWSKTTAHGKLALVEKNSERADISGTLIGGRLKVETPLLLEKTNLGALSENFSPVHVLQLKCCAEYSTAYDLFFSVVKFDETAISTSV